MTNPQLPIAILVATGFEEQHLTETQKTLLAEGCQVKVISSDAGLVQGWHDNGWGHHFMADADLADILSTDFAGLIIPAGARAAASLRQKPHALRLVKAFADAGKPMALLGEAAGLLVAAEIAVGRTLARDPATQDELDQAGANLVDEAIHVDGALISTSSAVNIHAFHAVFAKALSGDDEVERAA